MSFSEFTIFSRWGLGNEKITEMSLNCLASRLNSLSKLTFLQLVLSLDRYEFNINFYVKTKGGRMILLFFFDVDLILIYFI